MLRINIRKYIKSETTKNISILASGTVIAQLIPIALQPLLRRQFSAEDYGAYSVYLSLIGILIIAASFKYELAIILPKKRKEAANIFFLSIAISFLFNLLIFTVVIIWQKQIAKYLNLQEKYSLFLFLVPLGVFLYSFYQAINYWLIREKKFLTISKNKIARRVTEGLTQTSFSFIKNSSGLVYGDILGHIANVSAGLYQSIKNGLNTKLFSVTKLKYIAKKYNEYPRVNLIPSLMSACSYLLPTILINKFYTTEHTGYFDLSKMVLSIPLALIATSVSNVLLQKIAEKYKENKSIVKDLRPIAAIIAFISIAEIVTILLFGEELFGLVFGKKNAYSGEISEILVWSYAFNFFCASFTSIFIAMRKIKLLSAWQILYFISILSLFLFKHLEFTSFLKIYVIIEVSCYFLSCIMMLFLVLHYEKGRRDRIYN